MSLRPADRPEFCPPCKRFMRSMGVRYRTQPPHNCVGSWVRTMLDEQRRPTGPQRVMWCECPECHPEEQP